MSLLKFLQQVRGVDIGYRLPSELFRAIIFPGHQIVQAVMCPSGIEDRVHIIFLVTLDFIWLRRWCGLIREGVLHAAIQ